MFRRYREKWRGIAADLREDELLFKKFCTLVYGTKELTITPEEQSLFELYRKKEEDEYRRRETLFWPVAFLGAVFIDTQFIIPQTKSSRGRWLANILLGIPIAMMTANGVVFYKESFESHVYAAGLCGKYGVRISPEDREAEVDFLGVEEKTNK